MNNLTLKLFDNIIAYSNDIKNDRTVDTVILSNIEELGELSSEVYVKVFGSYKQKGKDGVLGEAIDLLSSIVDLSYVYGCHNELRILLTQEELEILNLGFNKVDFDLVKDTALCSTLQGDIIRYIVSGNHKTFVQYLICSYISKIMKIIVNSNTSEEDIFSIQLKKLNKWKEKYA